MRRVDLKGKVGAESEDGVTMDADASRRWTDGPDVHDQRKMLAKRVSTNADIVLLSGKPRSITPNLSIPWLFV